MDFFLLKKFIGAMLMPLPLCTILLLIAVLAFIFNKKRFAGSASIASLMIFLISSTPFFPNYMLHKIENQYRQYDLSNRVNHIVVLGCAHSNIASLPLTSQLHSCSMIRVTEAVRIFGFNPDATVITSGAAFTQDFSNAEMNKRMLMVLGVPESQITTSSEPRDTEEEAQQIAQILSNEPFALVTSASHMPRSMRLFEQYGLSPIAAPTEHLVKGRGFRRFTNILPSAQNIKKTERWWYETLGQSWLSIKSWFK